MKNQHHFGNYIKISKHLLRVFWLIGDILLLTVCMYVCLSVHSVTFLPKNEKGTPVAAAATNGLS